MKHLFHLLVVVAFMSQAQAQDVKRNIPYANPAHKLQVLDVYLPGNGKNLPVVFWNHGGSRQGGDKSDVGVKLQLIMKRTIPYATPAHKLQVLDVYSPGDRKPGSGKNLPVVFWIHGGGWQGGDKSDVGVKPQVFLGKGFVFVSTNYRLLPGVDMATIVRDVAMSIRWVHDHIAEYGGDPKRMLVMGHSAGAQLAALICTDERYLKAEGLSLAIIRGCVPVDGDTYDVPAIIETAETRWRVHGLPRPKVGHREKFGNDPAKHRDFSAVTHVAKDKGIPPFLILHVAGHPDTTAQARRLGNVLKAAGIPATVFAARETTHNKINADLGKAGDPATKVLFEFLDKGLKK